MAEPPVSPTIGSLHELTSSPWLKWASVWVLLGLACCDDHNTGEQVLGMDVTGYRNECGLLLPPMSLQDVLSGVPTQRLAP